MSKLDTPISNPSSSGAKQAASHSLVLRMLALAWRYRLGALGLVVAQMALLVLVLSGLSLTGLAIDVLQYDLTPHSKAPHYPFGAQPPDQWSAMRIIAAISAAVLALAALRFGFERITTLWKARLVANIVIHLRAKVYDKLQRLSFRFFDANESSTIINRVTGDVQAVRSFVDGVLVEVLMMLLSLTLFLVYMLNIHVMLTLCCLATTPLLWVLTATFSRIVKPAYRKNRKLFDNAVRALAENIQGVHVVKGFSRQRQEIENFHQSNDTVTQHKQWIFWRLSIFSPLIGFVPQLNLVVLLVYGGYLYLTDPAFGIGSGMVVFAGLLQQFSAQVGNIAQIANSVQHSLTGAQRVFEVLDTPTQISSPPRAVPMGRARGLVSFENVSFRYEQGRPVLENMDLVIEPGECVAILGTTGSGKSTLLSLIPRFYDPDHGRITIDGIDIRELKLDDLRRNIGVVFQETFLFSCTVTENIAFGHPEATGEQIEQAARVAAAHNFIMDLPHGYQTVLSEGGRNLSGGQRQRLAIARAVLWEPPILLLDDPTASIDPETEDEILLALDNARAGRATFIVTHRLSTLKRADLVLVLDKGQIAQSGTHHQLIGEAGHYRHAVDLQTADDESRRLLGIGREEVA